MRLPDIYGELTCMHLNHWVYPYSSFKVLFKVAMYDIIYRVSQIQDTLKSLMLFDFWAPVIIMVAHDNSQCKLPYGICCYCPGCICISSFLPDDKVPEIIYRLPSNFA